MATPELAQQVEQLKYFIATAPSSWEDPSQMIQRYTLPTGETISCLLWKSVFYITGTDIVKCLVFRFMAIGRPVKNIKKFEEGVFSDLRNLKPGIDASLEEPRSEFLEFLYKHNCIRTQKKQKVFYWFSVPHDRLFMDALERDLKRESTGQEPATVPTASFQLPMALNGALMKPPFHADYHASSMSSATMQHQNHSPIMEYSAPKSLPSPRPAMAYHQQLSQSPFMSHNASPVRTNDDVRLDDWLSETATHAKNEAMKQQDTFNAESHFQMHSNLNNSNKATIQSPVADMDNHFRAMEQMSSLIEANLETGAGAFNNDFFLDATANDDGIGDKRSAHLQPSTQQPTPSPSEPTPTLLPNPIPIAPKVPPSNIRTQFFLATPPMQSSPVPFMDGSPNYKQRRRSSIFRPSTVSPYANNGMARRPSTPYAMDQRKSLSGDMLRQRRHDDQMDHQQNGMLELMSPTMARDDFGDAGFASLQELADGEKTDFVGDFRNVWTLDDTSAPPVDQASLEVGFDLASTDFVSLMNGLSQTVGDPLFE
jgi:hypothetical protein